MFNPMPLKTLNKELAYISSASCGLVAAISNILPSVLFHALKDGQITPACGLVAALNPKHRATVVEFLCTYGPFAYSRKEGLHYSKVKAHAFRKAGTPVDTYLEEEVPAYHAWEAQSQQVREFKDLDVEAAIKAAIARIQAQAAKVQEAGKKVTLPTTPALLALYQES